MHACVHVHLSNKVPLCTQTCESLPMCIYASISCLNVTIYAYVGMHMSICLHAVGEQKCMQTMHTRKWKSRHTYQPYTIVSSIDPRAVSITDIPAKKSGDLVLPEAPQMDDYMLINHFLCLFHQSFRVRLHVYSGADMQMGGWCSLFLCVGGIHFGEKNV